MSMHAVIFDLNGTVLNDDFATEKAFRNILRRHGVEVDADPHIGGIGIEENWQKFILKYKIETDRTIEELTRETQDEYLKYVDDIYLRNGFEALVNFLRKANVKIALATSNMWRVVDKLFLEIPRLEKSFDEVITGEEVSHKKPSPEIFLIAADKLNVDSSVCIVIEDSEVGIEAAKAAGMKSIGVYKDDIGRRDLSDADMLIQDFEELLGHWSELVG